MPRKKGEVMWPRLVASKILRKRIGSNNFVADFPTDVDCLQNCPHLNTKSVSSNSIFCDYEDNQNYNVFVSTWNVGGLAPTDDLNMDDLLDISSSLYDIYVLGFQEVVPLRASNVLGSENNKISMKWNSIVRKSLNKKKDDEPRNTETGDYEQLNIGKQFRYQKNNAMKAIESRHDHHQQEFRCIISKQMVGILISVWIRSDLHCFVRNPSVSCVGCGIMGCLGNKGSVAVRFLLHETSLCFVCSHLASGGKEGDEKYRNSNVAEIFSRTSFPKGGHSHDLPRKIREHDRIILLGDLNYRISLPESDTRLLVDRGEWKALLKNDQLRMELMDGQVFEGWHEGTIKFPPTYKYYPNSDEYYGGLDDKKAQKKRAPAWCDRIIWYGEGIKQHLYSRSESRLSDHRPVKATFSVEVKVSRKLKALQNFFLSERFEEITNCLEIHKEESFPCNGRASFHM